MVGSHFGGGSRGPQIMEAWKGRFGEASKMEGDLEALLEMDFCTKPPNFGVEANMKAPTGDALTSIINRIRTSLGCPFFMEVSILMAWSIWSTRNAWIFNDIDPSVEGCRGKFIKEFSLLLLRAKPSIPALESWLASL
jgi:hypothetical protein